MNKSACRQSQNGRKPPAVDKTALICPVACTPGAPTGKATLPTAKKQASISPVPSDSSPKDARYMDVTTWRGTSATSAFVIPVRRSISGGMSESGCTKVSFQAAPELRRVLRGGCFSSGRMKANCNYRGSLEPGGYWRGNGFRVVVAARR